jgi:hypothetical membrane protein
MRTRFPVTPLALAGIIGPLGFVTLVIIQGILQPDYSHITMPISALAAWPAGWLQNLNFFVTATLLAAFVVGVHTAIRPTRFGLLGIAMLFAASVGLFMAGVFPWVRVDGVPTETPQHIAAAVVTFVGAGTGLIALSRRMTADPRWLDLSAYVLGTGIVMLMLFIVLGGFTIQEDTPFHDWAGLLQRVLVMVWFACLLVMARRVLRLARESPSPPSTVPG